MTSKEIIKRVITFNDPPRIGLTFNEPYFTDVHSISAGRLTNRKYDRYAGWGSYPELLSAVPGFRGEVRTDSFGNIYGRLDGKTSGECLKGALQDGWELLNSYELPELDESEGSSSAGDRDEFTICSLISVFSSLRDIRRMDMALADTALEPEMVSAFMERIQRLCLSMVRSAVKRGADAMMIYDDWGTQTASFISPQSFRKLFKPVYKAIADEVHANNMFLILHSCGYIYSFIEDFIDAGIDVLQLDQPELMGMERLVKNFGGRVTFWSPVDIQKIMATGDRKLIEDSARRMADIFMQNGGFIAKDYPSWKDIDITDEWAGWARDVFMEIAGMKI